MMTAICTLNQASSLSNHKSEVETWEHINEIMKLLCACDLNLTERWLGKRESGHHLNADQMTVLDILEWFAWSQSSLEIAGQRLPLQDFVSYQGGKGFDEMMRNIIQNTLDDITPGVDTCLWISASIRERVFTHDRSKLQSPEVEIFSEWTPQLKATTYGSSEYYAMLKSISPALTHHYAHNRHHPECFKQGVAGMNLIDLLEMIADWKASTLRHADGNIFHSIEVNKGRFNLSDQLVKILVNTVPLLADPYQGLKTQRSLHKVVSKLSDRLKPIKG